VRAASTPTPFVCGNPATPKAVSEFMVAEEQRKKGDWVIQKGAYRAEARI